MAAVCKRVVSWVVAVLVSPLCPFCLLFFSVHPFTLLYMMDFWVVNRTTRPIWITPVGTTETGAKAILYQYAATFPALQALRDKDLCVLPGGSRRVLFYRKGLRFYDIIVRNAEREYRQFVLDPLPSDKNFYRSRENTYPLEDWGSLAPVAEDVLAAATGPDHRDVWLYFAVGVAMTVFYGWLLY